MNFLKKAMGAFIEIEDDPKESSAKIAPVSSLNFSHPTAPKLSLSSQDVEKFSAHFEDLMDKANLPGPDYYEFSKVLESLETHILDEHSRISAAFASLSVQSKGLTKIVLTDTAKQYVQIIEKDRQGFEDALKTKLQAEVDTRKQEIDNLTTSLEDSKKRITDLQKNIADSEQRMKDLKDEAASVEMHIRKNEGAYLKACDVMIEKINNDIQKIQVTL